MKKITLVMAFFAILAASALAQTPTEISGGILNGKAMTLPKPEYPEAAKAAGIEGVVYVNVVIDEAGNLLSAKADDQARKVYKAGKDGERVEEEQPVADFVLRDAAERAAWQAKFSPTMLNGVPVRVKGTITYAFVASQAKFTVSNNSTGVRPKSVYGGVLNSKAISLPQPVYPPAAKAVKAQGAVSVQVTVDEGGNVISAAAVSGHPLLRAAAVDAARQAKFAPVMLSGDAVKFSGVLTYNFVATTVEEN